MAARQLVFSGQISNSSTHTSSLQVSFKLCEQCCKFQISKQPGTPTTCSSDRSPYWLQIYISYLFAKNIKIFSVCSKSSQGRIYWSHFICFSLKQLSKLHSHLSGTIILYTPTILPQSHVMMDRPVPHFTSLYRIYLFKWLWI